MHLFIKLLNRYPQTMINVKYNRDSDTYYIGKEDQKNFIVIDSSHNEENKKRRMRKRKNKDSIDEISQELLIKPKKKQKQKTNKQTKRK